MTESDKILRENVINCINRCLVFDIKPIFEKYYVKYDVEKDILDLLYIDDRTSSEIVVPNIFDKISTELCCENKNLKCITFGDRLKIIGHGAFMYNMSLEYVDLSQCSNLIIEQDAFVGCVSLKKVISNGITTIGSCAFKDCLSLIEIDLSQTKSISQSAFNSAFSLCAVDLSSVEKLESRSFVGCKNLTDVTINKKIYISECNDSRFPSFLCNKKLTHFNVVMEDGHIERLWNKCMIGHAG